MRIIDGYPIIVTPKFRQCHDFWGQQNPDPANRHRPTLGLPILIGMQSTGPDSWAGRIYNADNGKTYAAKIILLPSPRLSIRQPFRFRRSTIGSSPLIRPCPDVEASDSSDFLCLDSVDKRRSVGH
jgi:Uncharacterized protein conserved in bacteria (DUF2147)